MNAPRTPFEKAMLRVRAREWEFAPQSTGSSRQCLLHTDGHASPPKGLEVLAQMPPCPGSLGRNPGYEIEPDPIERTTGTHRAASVGDHQPRNGISGSADLDAEFIALRTDLSSGRLKDPSEARMRYIAYVKSFHPDLVTPDQEQHASLRLAELHQLIAKQGRGRAP